MRLADLGFLYAVVGTGCAAALIVERGRRSLLAIVPDAVLLVVLWPLYGPFVLLARRSVPDGRLSDAVSRAAAGPLSPLLPSQAEVDRLTDRVATARRRIEDIDALLAGPDHSLAEAERQLAGLASSGASEVTIAAIAMRAQNLRRLHKIRDRYARELEDVARLLNELTTHAHVVRLAGESADETPELVRELALRVEGLDGMLDDELGERPWRRS